MYMRVQYNFAKSTTWRDQIDISKYTGMEVEHGLNTAGIYEQGRASNLGHFDPNAASQNNTKAFTERVEKEFGNLKK